jgi:hypothetical protein
MGDLQLAHLYKGLPDPEAGREGMLRIVDDSGEDYLYPKQCFAPVRIEKKVAEELALK